MGVVQLNAGQLEQAAGHFERALVLDGHSDKAEYGLAAAHALRHDREKALLHLKRSIERNPENRIFAANDSDLESLRDDPEFLDLLGAGRAASGEKPVAGPAS